MAAKKTTAGPKNGPQITAAVASASYQKVQPLLPKLKPEEVTPVQHDVQKTASAVLGVLPRAREFADAIAQHLPKVPAQLFDDLEHRAYAAWYAEMLFTAPRGEDVFKQMIEEASHLREALLVSAGPLVYKGLVEKEKVDAIRKGQGHLDKANDLQALGELYESIWPKIQGKTAVERPEWERALELGPQLVAAIGARQAGGPASKGEPDLADTRARAFTLLQRAYEELRRALAYLRWYEDDFEEIAPALFKAPSTPRAKKAESKTGEPPAVEATATPEPPKAEPSKSK